MERHLVIHDVTFELDQSRLAGLFKKKLIYECGTAHGPNVHLDVDKSFSLEDVEAIILSITGRAT